MPTAAKTATQARLAKEEAERDAKMAKQKAARIAAEAKKQLVDHGRLKDIGREIEIRVKKLNQIGGKAVDMVDAIDHLLADAKKLCKAGYTFEEFKKTYCPKLGQSRAYELIAVRDGRKSLEEIRADTRRRVARHRAARQENVTENDSVTQPEPKTEAPVAKQTTIDFPAHAGGSQPVLMASAEKPIEQVQAQFAALAGEEVPPAGGLAEIDTGTGKDDAVRAGETSPAGDHETAPATAKSSRLSVTDTALHDFTARVLDLVRRIAKHDAKRFAGTAVPGDELLKLGEFFTELGHIKSSEATSKVLQ